MGVSAAGLLILAVFLTGTLTMFRAELLGNLLISNAAREASRLAGDRVRTEISLKGATISTGGGSCTLTLTGDNTGATSIVDFPSMDFIILFPEGMNMPQQLIYSTGGSPVSTGGWVKGLGSVLNPDLYQPGILNPAETIVATAKLYLPMPGDTSATVVLGAPNGITDSLSFGLSSPCP